MSVPILKLSPYLTPRPWGGTRLSERFGKPVPSSDEPIGESWELSDHPDGPSSIEGGPFSGRSFGEVLREHPLEMVGYPTAPERFPLLVKFIDAKEDLSIQVHPDDAYTNQHQLGDRGKTECWYILDCNPGAEVIYGLQEGVGRKDLARAVETKTIPDVVRRVPIAPGDFLYVPAGTVHALLAGTLLCEIQQSSNRTYRLWDWDRRPERELHIESSLDVTDYDAPPRQPYRTPSEIPAIPRIVNLTSNPFFFVHLFQLGPRQSIERPQSGKGLIINVVAGEGCLNGEAARTGDTFFVPACVPSIRLETGVTNFSVLVSRSNE